VPFRPEIWESVKHKAQRPYELTDFMAGTVLPLTEDATCVFLTSEKRCAVYEQRPPVCHLFGTIPELPCSYAHPEWPQNIPLRQYARLFCERGIDAIL